DLFAIAVDRSLHPLATLPAQYVALMLIVDLDGDGRPDIAWQSLGGRATFLRNAGNLHFEPSIAVDGGVGHWLSATADFDRDGAPVGGLAIADFDGDARLDVAATVNDEVAILLGGDSGRFAALREFPMAGPVLSPLIADLNADGRSDLIVRSGWTSDDSGINV